MWRKLRWTGFLLTLAIQSAPLSYAADAHNKRIFASANIQVVSVTQDATGNFVLLSTQKLRHLPFPTMRYMPAPDGRAMMTVDFPGALFVPDQALVNVEHSPVKQIRIGQLQQYPPMMRISIIADQSDAFGRIDFRSSPGTLTIKLPDSQPPRQGQSYVPTAPAIVGNGSIATAQGTVAKGPGTAPITTGKGVATAPPAAKKEATAGLPKPAPNFKRGAPTVDLRAPLAEADAPDAAYIPLPAEKLPRNGFKRFLKKIFAPPESTEEVSREEVPPKAPNIRQSSDHQNSDPYGPPVPRESIVKQAASNPGLTISSSGSDPLTLQLQSAAKFNYKTFRLRGPDRFVIDLEGIDKAAQIQSPELLENKWARAIRIGNPDGAPNITRVVLDLESDEVAVDETPDEKTQSLRITLHSPSAADKQIAERKPVRADALVVLDAGHGGTDPGAQRGDIQEKEITLAIVEKLKKQLESKGIRVRLTRSDDTYVSLEDRVRITNALQPDAFVSVHINSLEANNLTTGIETYYQNEHSKDLAKVIHSELVSGLNAPDRSVRKARFYVINHTPVPAILAEVGFISNKEERDKLTSSDYQKQVASALADGVLVYLSEHSQSPPVAPNITNSGTRTGSGTISTATPSASAQSFTQNLHSTTTSELNGKLKFKKHRIAAKRNW